MTPTDQRRGFWQQILTRQMLICIFTGFSSGLPLFFLLQLLPAWFTSEQMDIKTIGLMALLQMPFTFKFLWAPLLDGTQFWGLGRRRSWMLLTQAGVMAAMAAFGFFSPVQDVKWIAALGVMLSLFAASQDIAVDAFRREILSDEELGFGNSVHVNAYRLAGLVPGSLSLILSDHLSWPVVFAITALFMLPGLFMTLFLAREPKLEKAPPRTLKNTVVEPFVEFFSRKGVKHALLVLAFLLLYKLGDSMATALQTPFYRHMGFSNTDIGMVNKTVSLSATVIFGILGGIAMLKIGINRALWLFGLVQWVSILGFVWLAGFGHFDQIGTQQLWMLGAVAAFEYAGVGLGTAAFVAYTARETNPLYTATQLALLTSLTAVPRTFVNAGTGMLVDSFGYVRFFWICFFLAVPGLLLLFKVAPWNGDKPRAG